MVVMGWLVKYIKEMTSMLRNHKLVLITLFMALMALFWVMPGQSPVFAASNGDVNNDGITNSVDYGLLEKYLLGLATADTIDMNNADVYADGSVDARDLYVIRGYFLGMIGSLHVESASAEGTMEFAVNPASSSGSLEDTLTVKIDIQSLPATSDGIESFALQLNYDPAVLEYISCVPGSGIPSPTINFQTNLVSGGIRLLYLDKLVSSSSAIKSTGTLCTLTFKIKNYPSGGTTDLTLMNASPSGPPIDIQYKSFSASYTSGTVNVNPPKPVTLIEVTGSGGLTTMADDAHDGTLQMAATVSPNDASEPHVTWSVMNGTGSALISSDGLLSHGTLGTVTVQASAQDTSGKTGELEITVSGVRMSSDSLALFVDDSHQLTAAAVPNDTSAFIWASDTPAVASVDNTGKVRAVTAGSAKITATTTDGREGICNVNVDTKPPANLQNLEMNAGTLSPAFDENVYQYSVHVGHSVESITFTATTYAGNSADGDGMYALKTGANHFEIEVSGDGYKSTVYTIVVTRAKERSSSSSDDVYKGTKDGSPEGTVTESGGTIPVSSQTELKDIDTHWASDSIHRLAELGIVTGNPDGTFKPDLQITRAEFTVMLVKALKLQMVSGKTFNDTSAHWGKDYIATAYAAGIISGYSDEEFGADDPITREEMAVMITKAMKLTAAGGKNYIDNNEISPWATEAVASVSAAALMTGYPDGTFRPKTKTTRAEAAVVIIKSIKQ